jgi:hypothetical protein
MAHHWVAIGLAAAAVLAVVIIVIVVLHSPTSNRVMQGKSPIERVIPGFLNTFLFTYYASEYRAIVDGVEFCCDTPVIEQVIWPEKKSPTVQQGTQTIHCSLVIRLPEGRQTRNGHMHMFRDVSIHVPVEIELDNRVTIWVRSIRQTQTILYIGIYAQPIDQASLVKMFRDMFATFNRLAPFDTNILAK